MELRKQKERELHNIIRDENLVSTDDFEYYTSNKKWYSITRESKKHINKWLEEKCKDGRVLDYCCGSGGMSLNIAKMGVKEVIGIDISDVSVENATKAANKQNLGEKARFITMDAENMKFENDYFDVIYESGVLHHLDLDKSFSELARVLKKDGEMICTEALGHNPIIHYYRKRTPHLRTDWEVEHILRKKDIYSAEKYFGKVKLLGFFHLLTIGVVPFRNVSYFNTILSTFEMVDRFILKLPLLKWQAWQVVFILSEPKK